MLPSARAVLVVQFGLGVCDIAAGGVAKLLEALRRWGSPRFGLASDMSGNGHTICLFS